MTSAFVHKRRFGMTILAGVTLASIFFGSTFLSHTQADSQTLHQPKTAVMQQFLTKTNQLRATAGKQPLQPNSSLEASARAKLADMQTNHYWGHRSPSNISFSAYIWQEDENAQLVGENLARCYDTYDEAFKALVNSPTHYSVLVGDFTDIGVASQWTDYGCESIVMHVAK